MTRHSGSSTMLIVNSIKTMLKSKVFAKPLYKVPAGSVVLFPVDVDTLNCGLTSIIVYKE